MAMEKGPFRRTVGLFATGITVVTTRSGDVVHGMTANSFTSISLDPTLVLIAVDNGAYMKELLEVSGVFAVCVLGADQEPLARYFSSSERPHGPHEFDGIDYRQETTGAPILNGAMAFVDCTVSQSVPAGDHTLYLGEVVDMGVGTPTKPLLYFRGKYRMLDDV